MRLLFLFFGLLMSVNSVAVGAQSESQKIISDDSAYINVCSTEVEDCVQTIFVNNKLYKISYDENANVKNQISKLIGYMIGNFQRENLSKTNDFSVSGYVARERDMLSSGNEPDVFKIISISNIQILQVWGGE